jgi:hypothetical protein
MIEEHDIVVLTSPVPKHHLEIGDTGVVVYIHSEGLEYLLELFDGDGKTIDVVDVHPSQVRKWEQGEDRFVRSYNDKHSIKTVVPVPMPIAK